MSLWLFSYSFSFSSPPQGKNILYISSEQKGKDSSGSKFRVKAGCLRSPNHSTPQVRMRRDTSERNSVCHSTPKEELSQNGEKKVSGLPHIGVVTEAIYLGSAQFESNRPFWLLFFLPRPLFQKPKTYCCHLAISARSKVRANSAFLLSSCADH